MHGRLGGDVGITIVSITINLCFGGLLLLKPQVTVGIPAKPASRTSRQPAAQRTVGAGPLTLPAAVLFTEFR